MATEEVIRVYLCHLRDTFPLCETSASPVLCGKNLRKLIHHLHQLLRRYHT